jgi:hypothetical protein
MMFFIEFSGPWRWRWADLSAGDVRRYAWGILCVGWRSKNFIKWLDAYTELAQHREREKLATSKMPDMTGIHWNDNERRTRHHE